MYSGRSCKVGGVNDIGLPLPIFSVVLRFSLLRGCGSCRILWAFAFSRILQWERKQRRERPSICTWSYPAPPITRRFHRWGCVLGLRTAYPMRQNTNEAPDQMERSDIASEVSCPSCDSTIVYRTKRKGIFERIILYPLGYRAYRCEICDLRFRSRPKQHISPAGS